MAAVICTSIGDLCSASCNAFSKVICLPCKALNLGCESLGDLLCTPFMPYIIVTFALNTPAVVYGVLSFKSFGCYDLFRWLIVNAVLSAIHMIGCLYIVQKIRESQAEPMAYAVATTGNKGDNSPSKTEQGFALSNFTAMPEQGDRALGGANSFHRIKHVLCYDKGMALYILVVIVWAVWLSLGIGRRFLYDDANEDCGELVGYMNVTILCAYVWMMMVAFAFCCSLLCVR
jgi:hypothetical protein